VVDSITDITSFRHLCSTSRTVLTDLRHTTSIIKIWLSSNNQQGATW